jgi:superfamily II DNA helicase RecQ
MLHRQSSTHTNRKIADQNIPQLPSLGSPQGSQHPPYDENADLEGYISSEIEFTDDEGLLPISKHSGSLLAEITPPVSTLDAPPDAATVALKRLYGEEATWKESYQHDLILTALRLQPKTGLLAVLPTGYGKSLLFLIPAIVEEESKMVTVVFVPLRALLNNIAAGIRQKGIHCAVWGEQKTRNPRVISLLLVSMDAYANSKELVSFITQLESKNRLARVVLDEAHLIVSATYRANKLHQIQAVRHLEVPVILLTATLPPILETELLGILCFDTTNSTTWRLPTERSNIRYLLERPTTHKEAWESLSGIDQVRVPGFPCGWFEEWDSWLGDGEQGIIFCVTTEEVNQIACHQRIDPYHSKLKPEVCERNLLKWTTGRSRWIVGTSGLGAGIDVAAVKAVIHWGIPTDILDWVQMAGRGGRGIEWSYSITIEPLEIVPNRQGLYSSAETTHRQRLQQMLDIVSSRECIRPILSAFLDGRTVHRTCQKGHHQLCWNCTSSKDPELSIPSNELITGRIFCSHIPTFY